MEQSSAAINAIGSRPWRPQRRPTKQASYELSNHAKAYLEGGQFASGYEFLYALLSAATSISTPAQPYIGFLSPPAYIALASSLIVYPPITTKATSSDALKGSDAALRYLQSIYATIDGPAYHTIKIAFTFPEERKRRRGPGHRSAAGSASPEPGDIESIAGIAANAQSVWHRAEDFWHIVGWAFNCSVAHKRRWERWQLWLTTMLDFIEADWKFCVARSKVDEHNGHTHLQNSLFWYYIAGNAESTSRGMRRRIVKAILAMATPESSNEYREIWDRETTVPKSKEVEKQVVGVVNFETGETADYESDEEMQDAHDDGHHGQAYDAPPLTVDDAVERLGGQEAIDLRQRLIALLDEVARTLPSNFTTLSDFFDNVLEDLVHLPLSVFQVLLSTFKIPPSSQIAFHASLLLPLVSGKVPDYFEFHPKQEHFETILLPVKGTKQSYAANAKLSIILEQMFMYMMDQKALIATPALRDAIESGIKARHGVYGSGKGKKGNAQEEELGQDLMHKSSERLLGLLEVLEVAAGGQPQVTNRGKATNKTNLLLGFPSFGSGSSLSPPPDSDSDIDLEI